MRALLVAFAFSLVAGLVAFSPSQRAKRASDTGKRLYDSGDLRGALREFATAAKIEPEGPNHHYRLGAALFKAGLYDQARFEFETTIRLDPSDMQARQALETVSGHIATLHAAVIADELANR